MEPENWDPDQFDIATAVLYVRRNGDDHSVKCSIVECNAPFTEFSGATADPGRDAADALFGEKAQEYLSSLYELNGERDTSRSSVLVVQFTETDRYAYVKVRSRGAGVYSLMCFDFSEYQERLLLAELQTIGYRNFIENMQAMAFLRVLEPEAHSVFTSGAFREITGYSTGLGDTSKHWLDLVHPDDREEITREAEALFNDPQYEKELEYRIIRQDGQVRWMHSYDRNYLCADGKTRIVQGLVVDVTGRKEQEIALAEAHRQILDQNRRLEELATTDALTGLFNRRVILESLENNLNLYRRTAYPFSVFLFDLDNFKEINDTLGHDAGDFILVEIADHMKRSMRVVDVKARWGGEEFLVIFPHTGLDTAIEVSNKFLELVRHRPFSWKGEEIQVTFSGGVAVADESSTVDSLVQVVDRNLYSAKRSGRNRVEG